LSKYYGLSLKTIQAISKHKKESNYIKKIRENAYNFLKTKELPNWGPDLKDLNLKKILTYETNNDTWENLKTEKKQEFSSLGLLDAEKKYLSGLGLQLENNSLYHSLNKNLQKQGVIFTSIEDAILKYPQIIEKYFSKNISYTDHYFSALHYALFSGGTFIYVPKNVKVKDPLHSYFKMTKNSSLQAEHTLIVLEEGASLSYIEGCSAKNNEDISLHTGAVEIFLEKNAKLKYSSLENWSKNTYNLNSKRAILKDLAQIKWVGSNIGSKISMLYPCSILQGKNSVSEYYSFSYARDNQIQDLGAKVFHLNQGTSSKIISKSFSKNGGQSIYRGKVYFGNLAKNSKTYSQCDSFLLDDKSQSFSYPNFETNNLNPDIYHEAKVSKILTEDLFYLQSKGFNKKEAEDLIFQGILSPIIKNFPFEYAIEINDLISKLT
jgi:Fe-S cluster assembly protein SufB